MYFLQSVAVLKTSFIRIKNYWARSEKK